MTATTGQPEPTFGIDLLIQRGTSLDRLGAAVRDVAGVEAGAIQRPDDDDARLFDAMAHERWARIHAHAGGDFGFKLDLDGSTPRDHVAIAQQLARHLGCAVVRPDDSTLAPMAWIVVYPDGSEAACTLEDLDDDEPGAGCVVR